MDKKMQLKRNILDIILVTLLVAFIIVENIKWERLEEYRNAPIIIRHSKDIDLEDAMNEVDTALNYLPKEIKEYYFGIGNEISLKTMEEYGGEKWSVAFCEFEGDEFVRMEVLITEEVKNEHMSIIHEYGHFFDNIMGSSGTEEWLLICDDEMECSLESIDEYFMTPEEFFAQEFAWYCLDNLEVGKVARQLCPKAQQYIADEIEKFKKEYLYY